jgi:hypothetical protein
VVENTKHQLFDVIAQIEPLGYSSLSFEDESMNGGKSRKETTLQDLEKMFSSHVDSILKKYGIVVDNVTITKIDLAQDFIARSEEVQKVPSAPAHHFFPLYLLTWQPKQKSHRILTPVYFAGEDGRSAKGFSRRARAATKSYVPISAPIGLRCTRVCAFYVFLLPRLSFN